MKLYYLTSTNFALSNLALRRIKIARFSSLNDPFELLAVNPDDPAFYHAMLVLKDHLDQTKGLLCFSSSWDNPVLWGHYGDRHTGIALGFDVSDIHINELMFEVIYSDNVPKPPTDPRTKLAKPDLDFMNILLRTKFIDWKYENEWRIFVQLDHSTNESGMYFYDFSQDIRLTDVILGPKCEIPIDKVYSLASIINNDVKVIRAKIDNHTYKVVESC